MHCAVVGQAGAGKTSLCLKLACWLGPLQVSMALPDGTRRDLSGLGPGRLRARLAASRAAGEVGINEFTLRLGRASCVLLDAPGWTDCARPDPAAREGMVASLQALARAQIVVHVVDAARLGGTGLGLGPADAELKRWAEGRAGYLMAATKADLPKARQGLALLARESAGRWVAVCSPKGRGFREIRSFLVRQLASFKLDQSAPLSPS